MCIAKGRDDPKSPFLQDTLHLLERLLQEAEAKARIGSVLEILVLRALAYQAQGDRSTALSTLERALQLAASEGYIRLFVDEGTPMLALLRLAPGARYGTRLCYYTPGGLWRTNKSESCPPHSKPRFARGAVHSARVGKVDPRTPLASPPYGDLRGLPPVLIHVGSDEILLDDAVRLAQRLHMSGGRADLEIWQGMWHVWHYFSAQIPEGQLACDRVGHFLHRMFGRADTVRKEGFR